MRINHKRTTVVVAAWAALLWCVMGPSIAATPEPEAAQAPPPAPPVIVHPTDCRHCHSCQKPTPETPCLHPCSRPLTNEMAEMLAAAEMPDDVILLDMLSDAQDQNDHFGPVPFDHAGHAYWAELLDGCILCHHFTPEGDAHPRCRTCHELAYKHQDIRKPGLKGAYHRQCMGCHREWSRDTKCSACHLPRISEDPENTKRPEDMTAEDAIGQMHPPTPEPELEVYDTLIWNEKADKGEPSKVYFHHGRHTKQYGFSCAECHRGDSCARCHDPELASAQRVGPDHERHSACSPCHIVDDACHHCHIKPGHAPPQPFEHTATGWPLKPYHGKKGCRACHTTMPFRKLETKCDSCHESWDPSTFDHAVTGQVLDENHEEIDCADCHRNGAYDKPPVCTECHEEEEGFVFPGKRPGPVVAP